MSVETCVQFTDIAPLLPIVAGCAIRLLSFSRGGAKTSSPTDQRVIASSSTSHIYSVSEHLAVTRRFSVAFQMEGQHPFMQVDELPLEGLHDGRVYQVGHVFNGDFPVWTVYSAHRCYHGEEVWVLGNGPDAGTAHLHGASCASVGSLLCAGSHGGAQS